MSDALKILLAQAVPQLSLGNILTIICVIAGILANYFAMRSEIRIMRNEMLPIVRWWNRIAENQASRMFIRSRADDDPK